MIPALASVPDPAWRPVVQTPPSPDSRYHATRLRPGASSTLASKALLRQIPVHVVRHATDIRDSEAKRLAGITNGNGVQIFRCFPSSARAGSRRRVHGRSPAFPIRSSPAAPTRLPGDSMHTYSQNVAGMWLKYGVKSLKIAGASSRREIWLHMRCDDLLTMGVDKPERGAYKPPTERGAALAPGHGILSRL